MTKYKKGIIFVGDFLGYGGSNEYGLIFYSNEYRISFIDNFFGKNLLIYDFYPNKGKYLMCFQLWVVTNAIYMKNFQVLAINNRIWNDEGSIF